MHPYASYIIHFNGTADEIEKALLRIADKIGDQHETLPNLLDRYCFDDEDIDKDIKAFDVEETIEIWQTHDCVWIEDIEALSVEIASNAPNSLFSICGHIEDPTEGAGDEMDFEIHYKHQKLYSQTTEWYWFIHMDDFPDYVTFCAKICDLYGNPRYSEEDYNSFRASADEWYVLDSGHGEFSSDAPLRDPIRIKIKPSRR